MTAPYSMDLRKRALARKAAGETNREIAATLQISPSCVSKWTRRKRETGSLAPAQIGGYKPRTLDCAEWLRARVASGPFTLRGLTTELAERGIKTQQDLPSVDSSPAGFKAQCRANRGELTMVFWLPPNRPDRTGRKDRRALEGKGRRTPAEVPWPRFIAGNWLV
jgi:transposase